KHNSNKTRTLNREPPQKFFNSTRFTSFCTKMSLGSTSASSMVAKFDIRGFPAKCVCRTETTIFMSDIVKNRGRLFYRCLMKSKVQDALPKITRLEAEVNKGKLDAENLKGVINELMKEVVRTKTKVKRCEVMMKIVFVIICLINIVVLVSLM
ncbi:hypothetical protein N665_1948s0001, partial [Sinapis alba]